MNTLISRLLLFINTKDKQDTNYDIAYYLIKHYPNIDLIDIKKIMNECYVTRSNIKKFVELFGYHSWDDLHKDFIISRNIRNTQMQTIYTKDNLALSEKQLRLLCKNEQEYQGYLDYIDQLISLILSSDNIYLFGAIYPLSLCINFQNDLTALGKNIYINYENYNINEYRCKENDLAIFLSASGRFIREKSQIFYPIYYSECSKALITFSSQFNQLDNLDVYMILSEQKLLHDYHNFIMIIFDLIMYKLYLHYNHE